MALIDNIQNLCSRENTTLIGLEREIGLGRGTIRNWDKSSPSIDKLQKVADFFKVSVDYLIFGFHRQWLASGLKIIRGERTFTQFVEATGINEDELHELCAGTATSQPTLEIIEKINASKLYPLPPRSDILEAAGYNYEKVTAYPALHLRIQELRKKENLTIEELSEKAEIDSSIILIYDAGEMNNNPDPYVLAQIADVFDCTPDHLLGLANGFHRDRYHGLSQSKATKLIEQTEEIIKQIDPYKYRNQDHQKTMKEIEEYKNKKNTTDLSPKEERDIARDLEKILDNMESDEALSFYEGEPLDEESKELLRISLESTMRLAKQMAKKKFTPKKYRKEE